MPHPPPSLPTPWFLAIGTVLGWAGTRTAIHCRKLGSHRRRETAALLLLAWFPLLVWVLTTLVGDLP